MKNGSYYYMPFGFNGNVWFLFYPFVWFNLIYFLYFVRCILLNLIPTYEFPSTLPTHLVLIVSSSYCSYLLSHFSTRPAQFVLSLSSSYCSYLVSYFSTQRTHFVLAVSSSYCSYLVSHLFFVRIFVPSFAFSFLFYDVSYLYFRLAYVYMYTNSFHYCHKNNWSSNDILLFLNVLFIYLCS